MKLVKINYRDQIRESILDSILKGQLSLGEKLSLAEYARQLDTSVTPIREAFTQLEVAGILESVPNVGFCVKAISNKEAEEIYSLIGMMEAHALCDKFSESRIRKLAKAADKIESSSSEIDKLFADNEFHGLLIDTNEHPIAYSILKNLKAQVFLFELQFMKNRGSNITREEDHGKIVEVIRNGGQIPELIKQHWKKSFQFVMTKTQAE